MGLVGASVSKLVEVNEGFGDWEDEWGVVSSGRVCVRGGGSDARSPVWGISARRAWWSLNSVGIVVVVAGVACRASAGSLSSQ